MKGSFHIKRKHKRREHSFRESKAKKT